MRKALTTLATLMALGCLAQEEPLVTEPTRLVWKRNPDTGGDYVALRSMRAGEGWAEWFDAVAYPLILKDRMPLELMPVSGTNGACTAQMSLRDVVRANGLANLIVVATNIAPIIEGTLLCETFSGGAFSYRSKTFYHSANYPKLWIIQFPEPPAGVTNAVIALPRQRLAVPCRLWDYRTFNSCPYVGPELEDLAAHPSKLSAPPAP